MNTFYAPNGLTYIYMQEKIKILLLSWLDSHAWTLLVISTGIICVIDGFLETNKIPNILWHNNFGAI